MRIELIDRPTRDPADHAEVLRKQAEAFLENRDTTDFVAVFIAECKKLRAEAKLVEQQVRALKLLKNNCFPISVDTGEVIANVTLAMRHLEDARMRLGKAIQAADGGVSCYPS